MPGRLLSIKINKILEKDKALDKNRKYTKSPINRILKEKQGKPLKI